MNSLESEFPPMEPIDKVLFDLRDIEANEERSLRPSEIAPRIGPIVEADALPTTRRERLIKHLGGFIDGKMVRIRK